MSVVTRYLLYPLRSYLIVSGSIEKPNVMTADWITPLSFVPELVGVAIGRTRYSLDVIRDTREFVIAVPTINLLDELWKAGTTSGRNLDKRTVLNLSFVKSKAVKTPSIKECVANIECQVVNEVKTGDHIFFIGKILNASFREEFFADNSTPNTRIKFVLHLGKNKFTTIEDRIISM